MLPIATSRLKLRELTPEDLPAALAIWGDPETMRWYPRVRTADEVLEWIELQRSRYPSGTGILGMELRESGALIGDCGLIWQEVDGVQEPEIGYRVNRAYWNHGYATEAARAVTAHAFTTLGFDYVISLIRPENVPSRRVAEKNGLVLDRVVFWRGSDHCVYRREKETE